jgi:hypothetical protein
MFGLSPTMKFYSTSGGSLSNHCYRVPCVRWPSEKICSKSMVNARAKTAHGCFGLKSMKW